MKITRVTTEYLRMPLDAPFRPTWPPLPVIDTINTTLVRVETDAGIVGYGAGPAHGPASTALLGEQVGPMLVGLDPLRVERIAERLSPTADQYAWPWCLEMAVWDIAGKALGQPVSRLLGGYADRLPAYASFGERREAQERVDDVHRARAANFRACKLRFRHDDVREDLAVVAAVRDAHGGDVDLMVDANQGTVNTGHQPYRVWDLKTARYVADALHELGVLWLEEPLPKRRYRDLAELTRVSRLPIAGGELNLGLSEFDLMIRERCYDIVQVDVAFSEGIWGCRKIAAAAELAGLPVIPHTWSNGLALMANFHLACALPRCPWVEVPYDPPSFTHSARDALLTTTLEIGDDGMARLPDGPGLGVELDEDFIASARVEG
jgi:D-galactarolactone cycloisomerase